MRSVNGDQHGANLKKWSVLSLLVRTIVLRKDASVAHVGWFVSGYVRLLQSQYESKSARTVLKIISQNLADYF